MNVLQTLSSPSELQDWLEGFGERLKNRTNTVANEVQLVVDQMAAVELDLKNTFNSFRCLSSYQFVENRVYEEDETESVGAEIQQKDVAHSSMPTESYEDEILPRYKDAVETAWATFQERSRQRARLRKKSRHSLEDGVQILPHIIGSENFARDIHCGLADLRWTGAVADDIEFGSGVERAGADSTGHLNGSGSISEGEWFGTDSEASGSEEEGLEPAVSAALDFKAMLEAALRNPSLQYDGGVSNDSENTMEQFGDNTVAFPNMSIDNFSNSSRNIPRGVDSEDQESAHSASEASDVNVRKYQAPPASHLLAAIPLQSTREENADQFVPMQPDQENLRYPSTVEDLLGRPSTYRTQSVLTHGYENEFHNDRLNIPAGPSDLSSFPSISGGLFDDEETEAVFAVTGDTVSSKGAAEHTKPGQLLHKQPSLAISRYRTSQYESSSASFQERDRSGPSLGETARSSSNQVSGNLAKGSDKSELATLSPVHEHESMFSASGISNVSDVSVVSPKPDSSQLQGGLFDNEDEDEDLFGSATIKAEGKPVLQPWLSNGSQALFGDVKQPDPKGQNVDTWMSEERDVTQSNSGHPSLLRSHCEEQSNQEVQSLQKQFPDNINDNSWDSGDSEDSFDVEDIYSEEYDLSTGTSGRKESTHAVDRNSGIRALLKSQHENLSRQNVQGVQDPLMDLPGSKDVFDDVDGAEHDLATWTSEGAGSSHVVQSLSSHTTALLIKSMSQNIAQGENEGSHRGSFGFVEDSIVHSDGHKVLLDNVDDTEHKGQDVAALTSVEAEFDNAYSSSNHPSLLTSPFEKQVGLDSEPLDTVISKTYSGRHDLDVATSGDAKSSYLDKQDDKEKEHVGSQSPVQSILGLPESTVQLDVDSDNDSDDSWLGSESEDSNLKPGKAYTKYNTAESTGTEVLCEDTRVITDEERVPQTNSDSMQVVSVDSISTSLSDLEVTSSVTVYPDEENGALSLLAACELLQVQVSTADPSPAFAIKAHKNTLPSMPFESLSMQPNKGVEQPLLVQNILSHPLGPPEHQVPSASEASDSENENLALEIPIPVESNNLVKEDVMERKTSGVDLAAALNEFGRFTTRRTFTSLFEDDDAEEDLFGPHPMEKHGLVLPGAGKGAPQSSTFPMGSGKSMVGTKFNSKTQNSGPELPQRSNLSTDVAFPQLIRVESKGSSLVSTKSTSKLPSLLFGHEDEDYEDALFNPVGGRASRVSNWLKSDTSASLFSEGGLPSPSSPRGKSGRSLFD